MALRALEQRVEAARRFNRFYTRKIGVLHEGAYRSPFSLTEVRVLYELAHRNNATATALGRDLGLDAGYLSRILRGFERRGLVLKTRSVADGRQSHLSLTAQGRRVFAPLNARSHDEVAAMLGGLSPDAQARVVDAMQTIERLLGDHAEPPAPCVLRPPRPGACTRRRASGSRAKRRTTALARTSSRRPGSSICDAGGALQGSLLRRGGRLRGSSPTLSSRARRLPGATRSREAARVGRGLRLGAAVAAPGRRI